jgi:Rod binding domain-containing protein
MDLNALTSSSLSIPGVLGGAPINLGKTPADQRRAVADQFETILLKQFLNDTVGSMMGGEKTAQGSIYGYFLGNVLSQQLEKGGGLGLANIIEQQLSPPKAPAAAEKGPQ